MTKRAVSYLQGLEADPYELPAEDHRLNQGALWTPGTSGLRPRSGIVPGPGGPAVVTATNGGINIAAGQAVCDGRVNGTQGPYTVTWDAPEFRAVPAASATTYRRFIVIAHVHDQVTGGDADDTWDLEVLLGDGAGTLAAAVEPAMPTTGATAVLRRGSVDPNGTVSLTGLRQFTVPRGGILPIEDGDTTPGNDGYRYRDHPTLGLQRWDGARWVTIVSPVVNAGISAGWGGSVYAQQVGRSVTVDFALTRTGADVNFAAWQAFVVGGGLPARVRPSSVAVLNTNQVEYGGFGLFIDGNGALLIQSRWTARKFLKNGFAEGTASYIAAS